MQDVYSRLGAEGEHRPWLGTLLQRLERVEAGSRSTASYHSVVEPTVAGFRSQEVERPPSSMCQNRTSTPSGNSYRAPGHQSALLFPGSPCVPTLCSQKEEELECLILFP